MIFENEKTDKYNPILVYRTMATRQNGSIACTGSYPKTTTPIHIAGIWESKGYTDIIIKGRAVCIPL